MKKSVMRSLFSLFFILLAILSFYSCVSTKIGKGEINIENDQGIRTQSIVNTAQLIWKFKTGDDVGTTPVVMNGIVYFGSDDGYLYAVDALNGKSKWYLQTGSVVRTSPTVVEGIVYFGSDDGHLHAVDALSGKLRWSFQTGSKFITNPIVDNKTVYIGTVASVVFTQDYLYAIDSISGKLKWKFEPKFRMKGEGTGITTTPAVADGIVYFGCNNSYFFALDTLSGRLIWRLKTKDINYRNSFPTVVNGIIYGGYEVYGGPGPYDYYGNFYAIDALSGNAKWSLNTGGVVETSPVVVDGVVYFSNGNRIWAVNTDNGNLIWHLFPYQRFKHWSRSWTYVYPYVSSLRVLNGVVYFGCSNYLYAVDSLSGDGKWRFQSEGGIISLTVDGGIVYFGSTDGCLYAVKYFQ